MDIEEIRVQWLRNILSCTRDSWRCYSDEDLKSLSEKITPCKSGKVIRLTDREFKATSKKLKPKENGSTMKGLREEWEKHLIPPYEIKKEPRGDDYIFNVYAGIFDRGDRKSVV